MGKDDNSTVLRVTPVFDRLRAHDETGEGWLTNLLALPTRSGADANRLATPPIRPRSLRYGVNNDKEILLAPPISLLRWMVRNPDKLSWPTYAMRSETEAKRRALFGGDLTVRDEALALLAGTAPTRGWHVLEGPTHPDVYFETDDAIVVIEGKQTERGPTTKTSWLPGRDQMHRHLDAAWELRGSRRVYGFLIVEGDDVPDPWQRSCDDIVAHSTLERSLPHRSVEEQRAIAGAFLGATTWRRVCDTFGLHGIL